MRQTEFVILGHFLLFHSKNPKNQNFEKMKKKIIFLTFYPTNNLKNWNFEKLKKGHGDIIILHKCTKYHNHMLYCSWDMAHDIYNFYFSFLTIFVLLPPLQPKKSKFEKNEIKPLEITSFYTYVPKIIITWCTVPGIWCMTDGWTDEQTDRWKRDA